MSLSPAETKVRKLARLPGNCTCANCGTTKKFGFSTVCIKFHTFVCNHCKSSHQAISHRCKSLTMSSWSDDEVAELQRKGNDYARRTWLQNAPPVGAGGRPKEGDDVNVFKRFVVEVYEQRRYYGEDYGAPPASAPTAKSALAPSVRHTGIAMGVPAAGPSSVSSRSVPAVPRSAPPVAAPAPVADLLDFSAPSPASGGGGSAGPDMFQANFDAFSPSVSASTAQPGAYTSSASSSDGFANFDANPATSTSGLSFSFISSPPAAPAPVAAPAPAPANPSSIQSFADFSGLSIAEPAPAPAPEPTQKKQVMANMSLSSKASAISMMDNLPSASRTTGNINLSMGSGGSYNSSGNNTRMANMNRNMMGNTGMTPQMMQQMMMQQQQQNMGGNVMGIGMTSMNMGTMGNSVGMGTMGNNMNMGMGGMNMNGMTMTMNNMGGGSGGGNVMSASNANNISQMNNMVMMGSNGNNNNANKSGSAMNFGGFGAMMGGNSKGSF